MLENLGRFARFYDELLLIHQVHMKYANLLVLVRATSKRKEGDHMRDVQCMGRRRRVTICSPALPFAVRPIDIAFSVKQKRVHPRRATATGRHVRLQS